MLASSHHKRARLVFHCQHIFVFPSISEAHDEINRKWNSFQDKNLLRKLDIALNSVDLSSEEIKFSTSEKLQETANATASKKNQKYVIHVPPVEEDFPELAGKPTKIFPLPISHENQCKTVGLASNLDLFADEFSFHKKKESKYVPLKSSGKDFALDKAYERFAFMKSLEKHKERQSEYEKILRGERANLSEESLSESTDLLYVVPDEESSGDEED